MDTKYFRGLSNKSKAQLEKMALDLGMAENQIYHEQGGLLSLHDLWHNIAKKREQRAKGE